MFISLVKWIALKKRKLRRPLPSRHIDVTNLRVTARAALSSSSPEAMSSSWGLTMWDAFRVSKRPWKLFWRMNNELLKS